MAVSNKIAAPKTTAIIPGGLMMKSCNASMFLHLCYLSGLATSVTTTNYCAAHHKLPSLPTSTPHSFFPDVRWCDASAVTCPKNSPVEAKDPEGLVSETASHLANPRECRALSCNAHMLHRDVSGFRLIPEHF